MSNTDTIVFFSMLIAAFMFLGFCLGYILRIIKENARIERLQKERKDREETEKQINEFIAKRGRRGNPRG